MNINIYLQDQLLAEVDRLARETGRSRSALIREAIEAWLARRSGKEGWPASVRDWKGVPDFPPFETARRESAARPEDPFADPAFPSS